MKPYQYSGVNLTGIRLIQPEGYATIQEVIIRKEGQFGKRNYPNFRTKHALIYDSVKVFAEGFKRLKSATKGEIKKIVCNKSESWEYGISLNNFIKSVSINLFNIIFLRHEHRLKINIELFKVRPNFCNEILRDF